MVESFLDVCREGNLQFIRRFLETRESIIDIRNKEQKTALMVACERGQVEVVDLLIKHGACVNSICYNLTPLMFAIESNHIDIVKKLIEKGAEINYQNEMGWTPLMYASRCGHSVIIKMLINNGAEVRGGSGYTPLMIAAKYGNIEALDILLDYGVNVDEEDEDGSTPLIEAIKNKNSEIAMLLINNGANINARARSENESFNALGFACSRGLEDVAVELIKRGADINYAGIEYESPLVVACSFGKGRIAIKLIEMGAKLETSLIEIPRPFVNGNLLARQEREEDGGLRKFNRAMWGYVSDRLNKIYLDIMTLSVSFKESETLRFERACRQIFQLKHDLSVIKKFIIDNNIESIDLDKIDEWQRGLINTCCDYLFNNMVKVQVSIERACGVSNKKDIAKFISASIKFSCLQDRLLIAERNAIGKEARERLWEYRNNLSNLGIRLILISRQINDYRSKKRSKEDIRNKNVILNKNKRLILER
ncbi:MAG: ankyrin repeat domain-containing protein [Clostridiales bacterium]|nr:ankyrin repeat domain-containing protein [Clostridiales bacterium]